MISSLRGDQHPSALQRHVANLIQKRVLLVKTVLNLALIGGNKPLYSALIGTQDYGSGESALTLSREGSFAALQADPALFIFQ